MEGTIILESNRLVFKSRQYTVYLLRELGTELEAVYLQHVK